MGFAAEIKEFLGAAKDSWKLMSDTELKDAQKKNLDVKTAAEQKEMDDPLNQQLKEAKLAHALKTTAHIGHESPLQRLQAQYYQNLIDAQKNPPPGAAELYLPKPRVGGGGRPAGEPVVADPNAIPDTGLNNAKGGLIQKFAIGGMVDDEDLEDDEGALPPQAIPTAGQGLPVPGYTNQPGMLTPPAGAARRPAIGAAPAPAVDPRKATNFDAVKEGMKYNAAQLGQPGAIPTPARTRALRGLAQGAGAAPVDDMMKIYRKIDPDGEMGESERNLEAIGALYRFKMNSGDTKGAAATAAAMLQHYKTAATRYAAIAAAAFNGGEVDAGMKAMMKAYANIPDGNTMKLWQDKKGNINYTIIDPDGAERKGGIATPQQLADQALEVGQKGIEPYLLNAAGVQAQKGRGKGAPAIDPITGLPKEEEGGAFKPPKPTDLKELREMTKETVNSYVTDYEKSDEFKKSGKKIEPKEITRMNDVTYHILRNNDKTPEEALRLARSFITGAEPTKKGDALPFKVFKDEENESRTIRFPNGEVIDMPERDFATLRQSRLEVLGERKDEAAKQLKLAKELEARGGKSETMSHLSKAGKAFYNLGNDPDNPQSEYPEFVEGKKFTDKVAEDYPETAARLKSAVGAGKRAVSDAADWISKQAAAHPLQGGVPGTGDVAGPVNRAIGAIPALTANPNRESEYTEDRPL